MALPATNANLETNYSAGDYTDVNTSNDVRVAQTGLLQFMIHQFKDFTGGHTTARFYWEGQTTQACSVSTVYLQVYNLNTTTWDTIDSDNTSAANTDFVLDATINGLTDYQDAQNITTARVYQEAK